MSRRCIGDATSSERCAGFLAEYAGKACQGSCLETHRGCAEVDFSPEKVSPCFEAITPENVIEAFPASYHF